MISPQFAPVTPTFQANVQSQSPNSRQTSASTDTNNAPQNGNSFSHVLKSYSNDGGASDRGSTKTSKPDRDTEDKTQDAAAASEAASPVPVQQPLTLLSGLLGLLRQQQPQAGNQAEETETDQPASNQTDANAAGTQAQQPKPLNAAALTALMPAVTMPKALPKTSESKPVPQPHVSSTLALPSTVPADLQQFVNQAADSGQNSEAATAANNGSAGGTVTEAAGNTAASNGATPAASTPAPLAFSMLISPDTQNATNTAHPEMPAASSESASGASASDLQHFSSALAANAGAQTPITPAAQQHTSGEQTSTLATAFSATERPHASEDRAPAVQAGSATNAADLNANAEGASRPELRNMRVQLEGDANQRIDVRLTDQSGALRVSVRSADVNLTQTLQDHMPELTSRLEQQHFRTEVWVPRTSATSESGASNTRSFHSTGGNSSGQDQSGRRQNGRQQNQPDWLDEENSGQKGTQETN